MVVLTGATGLVGSALLRRLLAQGEQVRVLVRDPAPARTGPGAGADHARGPLQSVALRQVVRARERRGPPRGHDPRPARREHRRAERPRHRPAPAPCGGGRGRALRVLRGDGRHAELADAVLPRQGARRAGRHALAAGRDRAGALDRVRARRPVDHAPEAAVPVARDADHRRRPGLLPADLGRGRRGLRAQGPARGRAGRRAAAGACRPGGPQL